MTGCIMWDFWYPLRDYVPGIHLSILKEKA